MTAYTSRDTNAYIPPQTRRFSKFRYVHFLTKHKRLVDHIRLKDICMTLQYDTRDDDPGRHRYGGTPPSSHLLELIHRLFYNSRWEFKLPEEWARHEPR